MNESSNNSVTSAAISSGNGVGDSDGYERVFQLYWSPRVSHLNFFIKNWEVFRGLWFELGLMGVNTWFFPDCGYVKKDAG